ncbi:MAG: hypothetical protein IH804_08655, partial [Planctomycetes bacterium]|nr:hypothetical protein [Planctomycetota bacterium]
MLIIALLGVLRLGLPVWSLLIVAFAARAAVLYGLLPVFGSTGLSGHVSMEYRTVMFWGGLRGAVSLALALLILESPEPWVTDDIKKF